MVNKDCKDFVGRMSLLFNFIINNLMSPKHVKKIACNGQFNVNFTQAKWWPRVVEYGLYMVTLKIYL